jgi:hypothetical protein
MVMPPFPARQQAARKRPAALAFLQQFAALEISIVDISVACYLRWPSFPVVIFLSL